MSKRDTAAERADLIAGIDERIRKSPELVPSVELRTGPPGAYYDWVVELTLGAYGESNEPCKLAGLRTFQHLMGLRPETAQLLQGQYFKRWLAAAADTGQEEFEDLIRGNKPRTW